MNSACHLIYRTFNPRFLSLMASYDVAGTIHQSPPGGHAPQQGRAVQVDLECHCLVSALDTSAQSVKRTVCSISYPQKEGVW